MNEVGNFNITNTSKPVSSNITVVFSPSLNTQLYYYVIYKDNKIVTTSAPLTQNTLINFTETGIYRIKIKYY